MKKPAEIDVIYDRIAARLTQAETGSAHYYELYGAYRAFQWLLGFDEVMAHEPFEKFMANEARVMIGAL